MKKVCIFRVSGGKNWYRIYRNSVLGADIVYDVYKNRRRVSGAYRYNNLNMAIKFAVLLAEMDVYFISDGEEVQ